jgi:hypothetical protein
MKLGPIHYAAAWLGLCVFALAAPAASAQRGGAQRGGAQRGGMAARPAMALRGGSAARPALYGGRVNSLRVAGRPGYGAHHPIVFGYPYGYGLGWTDPGFFAGVYGPGYDDPGLYNAGYPESAYPDLLTPTAAEGPVPGVGQYAPAGPPLRSQATPVQAAPAPEDAVTLIFKDGRPPLQVHNYALTRTMLYVTDPHHRDIPVADLDLDATQKANADAGITFQLPTAH